MFNLARYGILASSMNSDYTDIGVSSYATMYNDSTDNSRSLYPNKTTYISDQNVVMIARSKDSGSYPTIRLVDLDTNTTYDYQIDSTYPVLSENITIDMISSTYGVVMWNYSYFTGTYYRTYIYSVVFQINRSNPISSMITSVGSRSQLQYSQGNTSGADKYGSLIGTFMLTSSLLILNHTNIPSYDEIIIRSDRHPINLSTKTVGSSTGSVSLTGWEYALSSSDLCRALENYYVSYISTSYIEIIAGLKVYSNSYSSLDKYYKIICPTDTSAMSTDDASGSQYFYNFIQGEDDYSDKLVTLCQTYNTSSRTWDFSIGLSYLLSNGYLSTNIIYTHPDYVYYSYSYGVMYASGVYIGNGYYVVSINYLSDETNGIVNKIYLMDYDSAEIVKELTNYYGTEGSTSAYKTGDDEITILMPYTGGACRSVKYTIS